MTATVSHKRATLALVNMQLFSTVAYAVLFSTLVLYMTQGLHLSVTQANLVMGGFFAFNYSLHLLGGYFGGRLLSYRNLFLISMLMQMVSCFMISTGDLSIVYWGLGMYLTGSGLNVTCINVMLTQRFESHDKRRENAFLWNYAAMNLGFFIGFTVAGQYQLTQNYHVLFLLTTLTSIITTVITLSNWNCLADRTTPLITAITKAPSQWIKRAILGVIIIAAMIPIITWLLQQASLRNGLLLAMGIIMILVIVGFICKHAETLERKKMIAYLILLFGALSFWVIYAMLPMGLTVFIQYNVSRTVHGFTIAPQWFQDINAAVIVLGAPLMIVGLKQIRKYIYFSIPAQFSFSLIITGISMLLIPIGIHFADAQGFTSISWPCWCLVLQSIGELSIGPIGYAMVGQLAPQKYQGIFMGTWMMMVGISGVLSSYASNYAVVNSADNNPLVTNIGYSHTFLAIGVVSITFGIVLIALIPFLRKLINEKEIS